MIDERDLPLIEIFEGIHNRDLGLWVEQFVEFKGDIEEGFVLPAWTRAKFRENYGTAPALAYSFRNLTVTTVEVTQCFMDQEVRVVNFANLPNFECPCGCAHKGKAPCRFVLRAARFMNIRDDKLLPPFRSLPSLLKRTEIALGTEYVDVDGVMIPIHAMKSYAVSRDGLQKSMMLPWHNRIPKGRKKGPVKGRPQKKRMDKKRAGELRSKNVKRKAAKTVKEKRDREKEAWSDEEQSEMETSVEKDVKVKNRFIYFIL